MDRIPLKEHEEALLKCFINIVNDKGKTLTVDHFQTEIYVRDLSITPAALVEVGRRFDLFSQLEYEKLEKISNGNLPALLVLSNDEYCVLHALDLKNKEAKVAFYGGDESTKTISLSDLNNKYEGRYIHVTTIEKFELRSDEDKLFERKKNWFWGTIWQFRQFYRQIVLAALIINLLALASPLFVMNVYDRVVPNNAVETLWVLAIGVIVAFTFDFILKTLRAFFIDAINKKLDIVLSTQLLRKALNATMESQPSSAGVRANHLKDFDSVRDFFSSAVLTTTVDLPFLIIFLAVIGYIGGNLFIVPSIAALIIILFAFVISVPLYHHISQTFVGSSQKTAILFESISSVELIKSTLSYASILDRWRRFTSKVAEESQKSKFYSVLATNFTGYVVLMSNVILVICGVYMIRNGNLTMGALIGCTILSGRALAPLGQITSLLTRIQQTRCSLTALNDVMASPEERSASKTFLHVEGLDGTIEFSNVSFSYPEQEISLLEDVSFKLNPGEKVALLGNMGSGKSTLFKLLLGLYTPTQGKILINDVAIEQYDPIILRRWMSYLEQSPKLLFGSALYNIKLKAPWASDERVLEAARISGAAQIISQHPKGFSMQIAEQGKGLSGGQVQTIALARTILPDSPILLLDEPTNSMDHWAEQYFLNEMKSYCKDKTLLLVTHKQSLLQLVDRIIVLQNGKIIMDDKKDKVIKAIQNSGKKG